jgi:hypothetical protein
MRLLIACGLFFVAASAAAAGNDVSARLAGYATVRLTADLSHLGAGDRAALPLLIDAAQIMDGLFWRQAYGDKEALLSSITDPSARRFAEINYGPWDRLDGDEPFIAGAGPKAPGANLYPRDMSKEEFERWAQPDKDGLYSFVRRDAAGKLTLVPYHVEFASELERAAKLLEQAAGLVEDKGFAQYLKARAKALVTDDYRPSDMQWMDMKDNALDLVIGPIETYEDKLYGYRASYEGYVLVKDAEWSARLARFAAFLPQLQSGLPVPDAYKAEAAGSASDLNAYNVVYYAGDCNAGSKTIAINLPNDEEVQLAKGTRRLQLENAMRAKFDRILVPIAQQLIAPDQRKHITFDAFFADTMFHEVAHGLGVKNTVNGHGTVREALKDAASAFEEGKADILGLYMITRLHERGELGKAELMDYYVTFLASIFRSVRFGDASAHGLANMVRFNFFEHAGAFTRDAATGTYRVELEPMQQAMTELSRLLLTIQGDGDYDRAQKLLAEQGKVSPQLAGDLAKLAGAGIPVDVVFEQGKSVLGL